jgi:hypothetical protein
MSSLVRFQNKNIFYNLKKRTMFLGLWIPRGSSNLLECIRDDYVDAFLKKLPQM